MSKIAQSFGRIHHFFTRPFGVIIQPPPNSKPQNMKLLNQSDTLESITPADTVYEAVVEHDGRYLVFSTANCPYEEGLTIQLLTRDGKELERVNLEAPYSPGHFRLKEVCSNHVMFSFWGDDLIRLTYHEKPKRVIMSPVGVHYYRRFARRHVTVEEQAPRNKLP